MNTVDKFKLVISDCHLSAGRFFEGRLNPHEDFYFDDELSDLLEYFCTGAYGHGVEVELIINGDFFDLLNVPIQGEFDDVVTEEKSLYKLEMVIRAHQKVMAALRRFVAHSGKSITYMLGNHDLDLVFPKVRERITREWDPDGTYPSEKVTVIGDRDRITIEGGVELHHGNQFEAVHNLDFDEPVLNLEEGVPPVLNLPWGSCYILKVMNRFKWEREYIDKVRPIKVLLFLGLIVDTWFTIRFAFFSGFYFLKTRFTPSSERRSRLKVTLNILREEIKSLFRDLESEARLLLDQRPSVNTVIFGHTHRPMNRIWPDGKQYINTGTWTKMINLDWRGLGQQFRLTFALIRIRDGRALCDLRQWVGEHSPHKLFNG